MKLCDPILIQTSMNQFNNMNKEGIGLVLVHFPFVPRAWRIFSLNANLT
jgi:hypothetical protein